jgi:hypothetical protein
VAARGCALILKKEEKKRRKERGLPEALSVGGSARREGQARIILVCVF